MRRSSSRSAIVWKCSARRARRRRALRPRVHAAAPSDTARLAVNLSDLAAMERRAAAVPAVACASAAASGRGLRRRDFRPDCARCALIGCTWRAATSAKSPGPLVLDVTVCGTVKRRQILTRSGARKGDHLYVTGTVGSAAAGLAMLKALGPEGCAPENLCAARYLFPEPRVRMGLLAGRNRVAAAAMDLSDGLADAVHQVAEASGVGAVIDADALPIAPEAREWFSRNGEDPVAAALAGGDDYELLLAVHPKLGRRLSEVRRHAGVELTRIGVCTEALEVRLWARQETGRCRRAITTSDDSPDASLIRRWLGARTSTTHRNGRPPPSPWGLFRLLPSSASIRSGDRLRISAQLEPRALLLGVYRAHRSAWSSRSRGPRSPARRAPARRTPSRCGKTRRDTVRAVVLQRGLLAPPGRALPPLARSLLSWVPDRGDRACCDCIPCRTRLCDQPTSVKSPNTHKALDLAEMKQLGARSISARAGLMNPTIVG